MEKDALGTRKIPADSYSGIFTSRARENFQLSGRRIAPVFWLSLIKVKIAAAMANKSLGQLGGKKADAIIKAGQEALKGKFNSEFSLDAFQAGAGTPYNMNVNEVLANRATELLGGKKNELWVCKVTGSFPLPLK